MLHRLTRVLSLLVLSAGGCKFDSEPLAATRPQSNKSPAQAWSPQARDGQVLGATQRADADADGSVSEAMSARPADARDAGRLNSSAGGSRSQARGGSGATGSNRVPSRQDAAVSSSASAPQPSTMDAGAAMACAAGHYDGTFDGSVTFLQGTLSGIKGTISAEMTLDAAGDALRVSEGRVIGTDDQGNHMSAGWVGLLNCKTAELESAELVDGAWDNGSSFSGTILGAYSASTSALTGTWRVRSNLWLWAGGDGNWSMRHQR